MPQQKMIQLPYSLRQVLTKTDRLKYDVFAEWLNRNPSADDWKLIIRSVRRVLSSADREAVGRSLLPYVGTHLTQAVIDGLSTVLAGNEYRLQAGKPVTRWMGQAQPEWVPVHVVAFEPAETRDRRPAARYTMRVMAGTPSGVGLQKIWSTRFVPLVAKRLGYTNRRGGMMFSDPSELVNLCLVVLIEPKYCRNDQPGFDQIGCTSSIFQRNRKIVQKRFRLEGDGPWPCPRGYGHRCYQCHVGFQDCVAATHRHTLEISAGP